MVESQSVSRAGVWFAALAPIAAVVLVAAAVLVASGDFRRGAFPWVVAVALSCLAACSLGVLTVHGDDPDWMVSSGAWATAAAMIGIAAFFAAAGIGVFSGVEDEGLQPLAFLPVIALTYGLLSMSPALVMLGIGVSRSRILRWWGRAGPWLASPLIPGLIVSVVAAEGTAEVVAFNVFLGLFAVGWVALGLSLPWARLPEPG